MDATGEVTTYRDPQRVLSVSQPSSWQWYYDSSEVGSSGGRGVRELPGHCCDALCTEAVHTTGDSQVGISHSPMWQRSFNQILASVDATLQSGGPSGTAAESYGIQR